MLCLAGMCYAPAPSHHRLLSRANSCLALFPNPTTPNCPIAHLNPYSLPIPLSSPHWSSPIIATFPSPTCALKRFPLTSPRKLSMACVKLGFLRTAEPHQTSQLSPCAPLCRSAMSMRCRAGTRNAHAPLHHRLLPRANSCRAMCPNPTAPTMRNPTSHYRHTFHPHPTRFPSLSLCTFHPFVVSTLALSNSSRVSFHGVRTKTFSTHVTT